MISIDSSKNITVGFILPNNETSLNSTLGQPLSKCKSYKSIIIKLFQEQLKIIFQHST